MYVGMAEEEVSIAGLRAEQAARRAGIMARIQSVMIFLLIVWISEDYIITSISRRGQARTWAVWVSS